MKKTLNRDERPMLNRRVSVFDSSFMDEFFSDSHVLYWSSLGNLFIDMLLSCFCIILIWCLVVRYLWNRFVFMGRDFVLI